MVPQPASETACSPQVSTQAGGVPVTWPSANGASASRADNWTKSISGKWGWVLAKLEKVSSGFLCVWRRVLPA
jgi:hypothetical protein